MLINYRENLPFKSDFTFARARNLKREIDKNFVLNITPHVFRGTFLTIAHKHKISSDAIKMCLARSQDAGVKDDAIAHKFKITRHFNAVVE